MGKTVKNLVIILGLATVSFGAYYVYTQQMASDESFSSDEQTMRNMLNNTRVFIQYRSTLNTIDVDLSFFEDERFLSLRNFTNPVQEQPIGRSNPFAEPETASAPTPNPNP